MAEAIQLMDEKMVKQNPLDNTTKHSWGSTADTNEVNIYSNTPSSVITGEDVFLSDPKEININNTSANVEFIDSDPEMEQTCIEVDKTSNESLVNQILNWEDKKEPTLNLKPAFNLFDTTKVAACSSISLDDRVKENKGGQVKRGACSPEIQSANKKLYSQSDIDTNLEQYLFISCKATDLTKKNPVKLMKELQQTSKELQPNQIQILKECIKIKCTSPKQKSALSSITHLMGNSIQVTNHYQLETKPDKLEQIIIFGVLEETTLDEIQEQTGATSVKRLPTKSNSQTHTPVVLGYHGTAPNVVVLGWKTHNAKPFIPRPLRCFNCQLFAGHVAEHCRSSPKCPRCGGKHTFDQCPQKQVENCSGSELTVKCANCGENHSAAFKGCSAYLRAAKITEIKVMEHLSYANAAKVLKKQEQESTANTKMTQYPTYTATVCEPLHRESYISVPTTAQTSASKASEGAHGWPHLTGKGAVPKSASTAGQIAHWQFSLSGQGAAQPTTSTAGETAHWQPNLTGQGEGNINPVNQRNNEKLNPETHTATHINKHPENVYNDETTPKTLIGIEDVKQIDKSRIITSTPTKDTRQPTYEARNQKPQSTLLGDITNKFIQVLPHVMHFIFSIANIFGLNVNSQTQSIIYSLVDNLLTAINQTSSMNNFQNSI